MNSQKPIIFESTAFQVNEYQNLRVYNIYNDKLSANQLKEAASKLPEVLLVDSNAQPLRVLTNYAINSNASSCTVNGQLYNISFEEVLATSKVKLELLFNHSIEFSDSIVRVSDKLFFVATETFLSNMKKDGKTKIYPFFCFEVRELENQALIIIKLMLYSQSHPNLMKALEEDYLHKSSGLDQLIVPLFKYKVNFLLFDSENDKVPTVDLRTLDFYENKENSDRLVKLKHLDTDEYIVMPAVNFNVLNKMDETALIAERLYLLYRLRVIISGLELVRRCGVELGLKTYKPDIVPAKIEKLNQIDLQHTEDDSKLSEWIFICSKDDVDIGNRLAKDLANTIKLVFRLDNFKAPKGYTVTLENNQSFEECVLQGLQNNLSDETLLVVLLINKEKSVTIDIEHLLLLKNKKYLIFEASELSSQRNYMQTKIDELYLNFGSNFNGIIPSFQCPISATFIKLKDTPKGDYMLASSLSISEQNVKINRTISRPSDFESLESYLNSIDNSKTNGIFFLIVDKMEKMLIEQVSAKNVVFVSKSSLSIFPNFSFSDYYTNLKLDLHNSRNFISYNKTLENNELVSNFNRSFVYGRIDRNNIILMNKEKSYWLRFVNSVSELDLPLIENIFLVITSLKNDFAYYFE